MLYSTVQSILDGDEVPAEIVIVDQSHEPYTPLAGMSPQRGCEICYHWNQSVGVSKARNLGLRLARYEVLVITDDDLFVAKDWLINFVQGLMNAGAKSVASGRVLASGTSEDRFTPSTTTEEKPAQYKGRIWKDVLWSNNMAMSRSVIDDIGFFDERLGPGTAFPAAEDNDYGFRLLEAGYQIIYIPSAVIYHRDWRPKKDYISLRWKYGVGRGAYYAKYFSWHDRYTFIRMIRDVREHIAACFHSIRGDRLKSHGDLVLAGGILFGTCGWLLRYGFVRK